MIAVIAHWDVLDKECGRVSRMYLIRDEDNNYSIVETKFTFTPRGATAIEAAREVIEEVGFKLLE